MENKHKNIIILGTSSGAGKSLITTGLCRIFYKDGYRVAPFKAQNMSRNFAIIKDNKKIAISQVLQGVACGLEPEPWMNPILLLPKGSGNIDIILGGEEFSPSTGEWYSKNKTLFKKYLSEYYENAKNTNHKNSVYKCNETVGTHTYTYYRGTYYIDGKMCKTKRFNTEEEAEEDLQENNV